MFETSSAKSNQTQETDYADTLEPLPEIRLETLGKHPEKVLL
jgi:hypothetical protein